MESIWMVFSCLPLSVGSILLITLYSFPHDNTEEDIKAYYTILIFAIIMLIFACIIYIFLIRNFILTLNNKKHLERLN